MEGFCPEVLDLMPLISECNSWTLSEKDDEDRVLGFTAAFE